VSPRQRWQYLWLLGVILLCLNACVHQPRVLAVSGSCEQTLSEWQATRNRSDTRDAQVYNLDDLGVFAVNRFLVGLVPKLDTLGGKEFWLRESWRLAQEQRQIELANLWPALPGEDRREIERCAQQALNEQLALAAQGFGLDLASQKVPDDYRLWRRILGLYPLTRLFVLPPLRAEQAQFRDQLQRVSPPSSTRWYLLPELEQRLNPAKISSLLQVARSSNPLGLPVLDAAVLQTLMAHYAPDWAIDTRSASDQPGRVTWQTPVRINVDQQQPAMYTLASYTQFQNEMLLQLNYFIWFSQRPKSGKLDLYGGELDGLIWRVTLRANGEVLAYDSIHQCGCFHQFFPVDKRLKTKPNTAFQEPLLVHNKAIPDGLRERVIVQLTHSTHSVVGVHGQSFRVAQTDSDSRPASSNESSVQLVLHDYNEVRSLSVDGRRQSLFADNGLIPVSRRLERWLLWPMGIESAGAMRQWGHHATAFVGRRHFDDANLLESLFYYE